MASVIGKKRGGSTYYYLVESARVDSEPRIVSQEYLGTAEELAAAMRGGGLGLPDRVQSRDFGAVAAVWGVLEDLGVIAIIDEVTGGRRADAGASVGTYLALAALNRVVAPCSKLGFADWWAKTAAPRFTKIPGTVLDHRRFWDAMHAVTLEADADRIDHLPAALALRQRPPVPGVRSTVGTMSEVLNVLRLIMSRLGTHLCPNGHPVAPTVATQGMEMTCPVCGVRFTHPGAESFAFNSYGACPACNGTGQRIEVDEDSLVPDDGKSIEKGAVLPWNSGGRRLMQYAAGKLGVPLAKPFRELTASNGKSCSMANPSSGR
jgi:hypothetical protein